jgi:hypothetical protein
LACNGTECRQADDGHETGSVEQIDDGLLMGYIDNFASELPGGRITAVTDSLGRDLPQRAPVMAGRQSIAPSGDVPNHRG